MGVDNNAVLFVGVPFDVNIATLLVGLGMAPDCPGTRGEDEHDEYRDFVEFWLEWEADGLCVRQRNQEPELLFGVEIGDSGSYDSTVIDDAEIAEARAQLREMGFEPKIYLYNHQY